MLPSPSALIHWCIYRWISWIWFPIDLQNTLKFCQRLHDPALPNNMEKRRKTRTQRDTSEQSITFFSGMRRCHPTLKLALKSPCTRALLFKMSLGKPAVQAGNGAVCTAVVGGSVTLPGRESEGTPQLLVLLPMSNKLCYQDTEKVQRNCRKTEEPCLTSMTQAHPSLGSLELPPHFIKITQTPIWNKAHIVLDANCFFVSARVALLTPT